MGAALGAAIVAAYINSLSVPFVFDDPLAITENPTIRHLWPLSDVLFPPQGKGLSVEGRPVLNLTLALNHAIGGTSARSYHVVNILIHALSTLTLFGLVRRTLLLPRLHQRFGPAALPLAAIVAALWSLHPLQTESVTYIIQRAESLVGLFYLLTLYFFVRAVAATPTRLGKHADPSSSPEPSPLTFVHQPGDREVVPTSSTAWFACSVMTCLIGMATKEVMVSAPLLALLFDRVFISGTLRAAVRQRGRWHLALFSTWVILAALVFRTGTRGGTAGFGINVTPWQYALTQFEAISRYVGLALWPHPLIFDYGAAWVRDASEIIPFVIVVGAMVAATIVAWWRWPAAAWLGLLFFAVLSPTSSIVPGNRQTLAEHRLYLPLAAIVVLVVCATYRLASRRGLGRALCAAGAAAALALGVLTVRRNFDYRSEITLYRDTAIKRPGNGFARYNLAKAYADAGRHADALPEYEVALRLMADAPGIHYNLANSLVALGRKEEAIGHYEAALRSEPRYARAHFNLGNVLVELGRKESARSHFAAAVIIDPAFVEARVNLGGVLLELGRLSEAREQLEHVLRSEPTHVLALFNLGNVCLIEQRWTEAIRLFEAVIAARPELAIARDRLALAKAQRSR